MDGSDKFITGIDAGTYYNYALVKGKSKPDAKIVRLVVDSRERNHHLFANPNDYEVVLTEPIPNINFAKLIASSIPFAGYLVNPGNNALHVMVGDVPKVVNVAVGDYGSGEELGAAVEAALNTLPDASFKVEYVPLTDNFAIFSASPFRFEFRSCTPVIRGNNPDYTFPPSSIAPMLGFGAKNYVSGPFGSSGISTTHVITSEFRKNMEVDDAIVLNIELMELNRSTMSAVDRSFAIIQRGEKFNTWDDFFFSKYFYPPVRIAKIRVRFTDTNGVPYDFQNQDHRLEFLFESNIKNAA